MSKKTSSVKLKKGYTLIAMEHRNMGLWQKTWRYKGIFACHKDFDKWVITHIPTGYGLATLRAVFSDVKLIMKEVEGIMDWTSNDVNVIKSKFHGPPNFNARCAAKILNKYQKES